MLTIENMAINNQAEKGCEWYFAPGVNYNVGPTDAAGQNFEGSWESLIRECIQNSLDAVLDREHPVRVRLEFKSLTLKNFTNFFDLRQHIKASLENFKSAERQYKPMLRYFESINQSNLCSMGYLQISDFNTKGMKYDSNNDSCDFSAFVRGLGVHGGDLESSGRGGSFGLGKSAIYKMSPIRTMFVSTYTAEGKYAFEGISLLTTHYIDGKKVSHIGYYDNQGGNPITNPEDIPTRFLRKPETNGLTLSGTDIMVMGRNEESGDVDEIIKHTLTHYWLSILRKKLVVEIIDKNKNVYQIDSSNLEELMRSIFKADVDNARNSINPKPYYNCVAHVDDMPGTVCIPETLRTVGKVELYLSKNRNAKNDRIAFFRMPCMMIMRKSTGQLRLNVNSYGIYGVFVCNNDKGDKILKRLENPAHDEWQEKHWTDPMTGQIDPRANEVMDEIREFLSKKIEEFCKVKGRSTLKMLGAGKYLYTYEDIVDTSDNEEHENHDTGLKPGERFDEDETGAKTTEAYDDVNPQPAQNSDTQKGEAVNETGNATTKEMGTVTVLVTPPKKKKNKTKAKNRGGKTERMGSSSDDVASVNLPVEYKVYANVENGNVVHHICIIPETATDSALVHFSAKGEDGKVDEELEIVDSFGDGTIEGMNLHHLPLATGENILKIRFSDNAKHALFIKAERNKL